MKIGFDRFIGIDYSGASDSDTGLKGLRLFSATPETPPVEILPKETPSRYWTRRGLAEWILSQIKAGTQRCLIGIDHGLSFPLQYFERNGLARDWPLFLTDFCSLWATDEPGVRVDHIRYARKDQDKRRLTDTRWRRLCERRCGAKSVFHFDVPGSVAKSTHAGLPWIKFLADQCGEAIHFWPFDGWAPKPGKTVIVEAYPSLYRGAFLKPGLSPDQQDAYAIAAWFRQRSLDDDFARYFSPSLNDHETVVGNTEGWIIGIC